MNAKTKRILKNAAIATAAMTMPAFAMADDIAIFTEVANDIEKLEAGVKVVGSAVVGVSLVGAGYVVAKRWIKRV